MTDRTNATEALDDDRDFPVHPALDEALEAAKFDDVKPRLFDLAGFIEPDGHLAVTLDPGDGIDDDLARSGAGPDWGVLPQVDVNVAHGLCPIRAIIRTCTRGRAKPAQGR